MFTNTDIRVAARQTSPEHLQLKVKIFLERLIDQFRAQFKFYIVDCLLEETNEQEDFVKAVQKLMPKLRLVPQIEHWDFETLVSIFHFLVDKNLNHGFGDEVYQATYMLKKFQEMSNRRVLGFSRS